MADAEANVSKVGVVVIGRNEAERLKACLDSVNSTARPVVYVDSGSTDDSIETARRNGAKVMSLDPSLPFSAARARNEGFRKLREILPELKFVQFVDGDCEMEAGWLGEATRFLDEHADIGAVSGRLRERFPDRSVYNMLCDMEWEKPPGEIRSCGGNALMRAEAFGKVGGFRPDVIAGEEPELCIRIRSAGWRICATISSIASSLTTRGWITTPSSLRLRLSAGIDPGREPPTSAW